MWAGASRGQEGGSRAQISCSPGQVASSQALGGEQQGPAPWEAPFSGQPHLLQQVFLLPCVKTEPEPHCSEGWKSLNF